MAELHVLVVVVVSTVVPGVVVVVEGALLVVVVVTSAVVFVDIVVDGGTVELLSTNQRNQILHCVSVGSSNVLNTRVPDNATNAQYTPPTPTTRNCRVSSRRRRRCVHEFATTADGFGDANAQRSRRP